MIQELEDLEKELDGKRKKLIEQKNE